MVEVLAGKRSRIHYMKNSALTAVRNRERLDGFARCLELTDTIERLLENTRSLAHWRSIL